MTNYYMPNTGLTCSPSVAAPAYYSPEYQLYGPAVVLLQTWVVVISPPPIAVPLTPDELHRLFSLAWEHGTDEDRAVLKRTGFSYEDAA